jgi:hypothetical protein
MYSGVDTQPAHTKRRHCISSFYFVHRVSNINPDTPSKEIRLPALIQPFHERSEARITKLLTHPRVQSAALD